MNMNIGLSALVGAAMVTFGTTQMAQAIVAVNDAALYRQQVRPGQFSGVVSLEGYLFSSEATDPFCTGSLLTGGRHILTAAHCVTDGANRLSASLVNQPFFANFNLASGVTQVPILDLFVLPTWDGFVGNGNDIAILSLLEPAPSQAEQYDIYRDMNELGQTFTKVGYGNTGNGFDGEVTSNGLLAFFGQNQFEGTEADRFNLLFRPGNPAPLSQLLYDFDSGYSFTNLMGSLGLGSNEVNTASGDSGGPAFIGNRVAGITSYGVGGFRTDFDGYTNSSFGELSGDTRVSTFASFIDAVLLGNVLPSGRNVTANVSSSASNSTAVPEPSTMLGVTMFGVWLFKRRKTQRSE